MIFSGMGAMRSSANEIISFGPGDSHIEGSIKYTLIGRYTAHFDIFKGSVIWDERSQRVESVYLEIAAASVRSNHPWCDKLARSRRLLNTARYPKIIFKGDKIMKVARGYQVRGILEMHGIKRRMTLPFGSTIGRSPDSKKIFFVLQGSWDIDRKEFNIVWNKYLDHGGIVVSDIFTVNWAIKAYLGKALY